MKLDELVVASLSEETTDADAQKMWTKLVRTLREAETRLKAKAGKGSSHSIGGNFHASVSGNVGIRDNYHQHGGSYGTSRTWNYMLEIGNNIDGNALDEAKALYNQLVDVAEDFDAEVNEHDGSWANVTIGSRQVNITYEYARSFCWVGIRVAK